jgi:hypothetical protein
MNHLNFDLPGLSYKFLNKSIKHLFLLANPQSGMNIQSPNYKQMFKILDVPCHKDIAVPGSIDG